MDFKKAALRVFLITLTIVIILNFVPIHFRFRLFIGSFGFGTAIALLAISGSKKYDL